jgi:predicted SAM-dependent methyltransferase
MLRQSLKDLYFSANRFLCLPATMLASVRYRMLRPQRPEGHYLHLGCGPDYLEGMINADGNLMRKIDLWIDLRNRLPFPDGSCAFVYSSHTLEHLYPEQAIRLLREIRRVLSDDGIARIAVPNVEHALAILRGECQETWPRHFEDPLAQAVNYLFCDGQHRYAYNFAILAAFAAEAGFFRVAHYSAAHGCAPRRYGAVEVGNEPQGSLVVELGASLAAAERLAPVDQSLLAELT